MDFTSETFSCVLSSCKLDFRKMQQSTTFNVWSFPFFNLPCYFFFKLFSVHCQGEGIEDPCGSLVGMGRVQGGRWVKEMLLPSPPLWAWGEVCYSLFAEHINSYHGLEMVL